MRKKRIWQLNDYSKGFYGKILWKIFYRYRYIISEIGFDFVLMVSIFRYLVLCFYMLIISGFSVRSVIKIIGCQKIKYWNNLEYWFKGFCVVLFKKFFFF